MTSTIAPRQWAMEAAIQMQRQAQQVAELPEPQLLGAESLLFARIREDGPGIIDTLTNPQKIDRDRCIYIFDLDPDADGEEVLAAATSAKKARDFALPQINYGPSLTLYVGSSIATGNRRGTLKTRLSQHILATSPKTYALSLAHWAGGLSGGLVVSAWQYPASDKEDMRSAILAVEDWLSTQRRPLLGQRGTKN